jgi:hypothetical protein
VSGAGVVIDKWKLETTIKDLETAVSQTPDAKAQRGLQEVLDRLKKLL